MHAKISIIYRPKHKDCRKLVSESLQDRYSHNLLPIFGNMTIVQRRWKRYSIEHHKSERFHSRERDRVEKADLNERPATVGHITQSRFQAPYKFGTFRQDTNIVDGLNDDNKVLFDLYINNKLHLLEDQFKKLKEEGKADTDSYYIMLCGLKVRRETQTMVDLYEQMRQNNIPLSIRHYNVIISAFGKLKAIGKVILFFNRLKDQGLQPNIGTYNHALQAFGKALDFKRMMDYFEDMQQMGIKPMSSTNLIMLHSFALGGHVSAALQWFKTMLKNGFLPDVNVFNAMILASAKSQNFRQDFMTKWYEKMLKHNLTPNVYTFNYLLEGFACANDTENVIKYFQEMKSRSIKPNARAYFYVLSQFGKSANVDEMLKTFEELKQLEAVPPEYLYNTVLIGLGNNGRYEDVKRIADEMKQLGYTPKPFTMRQMEMNSTKENELSQQLHEQKLAMESVELEHWPHEEAENRPHEEVEEIRQGVVQ